LAVLAWTRRPARDRSRSPLDIPLLVASAEASVSTHVTGSPPSPSLQRPPDSTRRSRQASSRSPRPRPGSTRRPTPNSDSRQSQSRTSLPEGADADSRLPLRRSEGPSPPKGLWEHSLDHRVASIAFEAKPPNSNARSAGDAVQCLMQWLTFRKTYEHPTSDAQLVGAHPKVFTTPRLTARKPSYTSRPAQRVTSGHPKMSTSPKARRARLCRSLACRSAPERETRLQSDPTADKQPRDEGPSPSAEASGSEQADCQSVGPTPKGRTDHS
jgi:hypothetical protein